MFKRKLLGKSILVFSSGDVVMSAPEKIIPTVKKNTILLMLEKGERLDGRKLDEIRKIKIETDVIGNAEGSAIVHLGNTIVIAGVKLNIVTPYADTPNQGVQIVNAELIPLASPVFEPGPPGEDDVELSRVIDRALRSVKAIDLDKLVIIPGKKVWAVYIDIYALNHSGNLIDASMLASIAALLTAKKPKIELVNDQIKKLDEREKLPITDIPVTVTFAKIGDKLVVDPEYEEELIMDARLTFGITSNGNICALQKGLCGTFKPSLILEALEIARKVADEYRNYIKSFIQI